MLRRTKSSTDRDGRYVARCLHGLIAPTLVSFSLWHCNLLYYRPILVLPPANIDVIYCDMTEAEKDFYEALFKRSKVHVCFIMCLFCNSLSEGFKNHYKTMNCPSGEVWPVCWTRKGSSQLCFYSWVALTTSSVLWSSIPRHEVRFFLMWWIL